VHISSPPPESSSAHLQPGDQHVLWDTENPSGYRNRTGLYKTRLECDFIRHYLPPTPAQVLDIGGGCGRFALKLGRMGYTLTVNDLHEPSLRLLHERAGEDRPKTVHGGFLTSEIKGTFDAALAIECLEHMPFDAVLRRVHDLLRPGGVFVFTVLNRSSWRFYLRRVAGRDSENESVAGFGEYKAEWRQAGFDEVAIRGFMWTLLTVSSNSTLVPFFVRVEDLFRLHAYLGQSPWLLVALRRGA
jgi:SAM-dependent methyltransferase